MVELRSADFPGAYAPRWLIPPSRALECARARLFVQDLSVDRSDSSDGSLRFVLGEGGWRSLGEAWRYQKTLTVKGLFVSRRSGDLFRGRVI